ncbi:efflux RND transporter periplasmic adaptor subunit (plasmid) [Aliisedimentitalea scapharcae]|uniref:Efflux RND transporter periplasmic adaptor subunit n=1 Tax=Aliisedimentitalea scapharcae TaxID=1524259 RepID=A0ABZ2Y1H3_9RHOB|nr:efflux RND transporter periplasmic adaptor subunit [Rhodobacteraceae bacterium M382]
MSGAPVAAQVYDCVIDPSETVDVAGQSGGVVTEVFFDPGEQVKKGQVLARLEATIQYATVQMLEIRAEDTSEIEAQRTQLQFLEGRLERTQKLLDRGVVSKGVLEEIQSSVDANRSLLVRAELARRVALGELTRAKAALSLLEIRSPIDGVVLKRHYDEGEYLPLEGSIATIVQLDPLEIVSFLPVREYNSVHVGEIAQVEPAAPLDGSYPAEISRIDRVFDVASGTFGLQLKLENPDLEIPAGHRCKVTFGTGFHVEQQSN